jgi:hypothetical protein
MHSLFSLTTNKFKDAHYLLEYNTYFLFIKQLGLKHS